MNILPGRHVSLAYAIAGQLHANRDHHTRLAAVCSQMRLICTPAGQQQGMDRAQSRRLVSI